MRQTMGTAALAGTLLVAGCDTAPTSRSEDVSRASFEAEELRWPLTVESGTLTCEPVGAPINEVTFTTGGTTYAVNGIAGNDPQYADIRPIWADDPELPGAKIDIGWLIDRGRQLCEE